MTPKEPRSESLLAARIARAYPTLSAYSAATLAEDLCRIERMQRRHAERCCSGEDGGYVRIRAAVGSETARSYSGGVGYLREHDPEAEERAGKRIERAIETWQGRRFDLLRSAVNNGSGSSAATVPVIKLQGDPRAAGLLVRLPGETEAKAV